MSLFDKLFVAHLVGDWLLQTEWQALNKGKNMRAMASHIGVYSLVMLGVLVVDFGFQNAYVYLMVILLGVSHAILDLGWPVIRLMKATRGIVKRKPERWLVMAVDQILHVVTIAIVALILSP